jgi:hypothetical protein
VKTAGIVLVAALVATGSASAQESDSNRLVNRASQDREIVYFLQAPESHSFRLHHDYTETKEGADKYVNVVRKGSSASNPSAVLLDSGEPLETVTLKGEEITKAKVDTGEEVHPDSEAVVVRFPAVKKGRSARIRITETYTDPKSYRLDPKSYRLEGGGDELVFDRTFGRPRNAVVLPPGWYLTACSIPATVSEMPDGRIRVLFVNARPDEIAVLIRAKRRPAAAAK